MAAELLLVFIHQEANVSTAEGQQGSSGTGGPSARYTADVCTTKYWTLPLKCDNCVTLDQFSVIFCIMTII